MEAHKSYSLTLKYNSWLVLPNTGETPLWQVIQLVLTVKLLSIIIISAIYILSRGEEVMLIMK